MSSVMTTAPAAGSNKDMAPPHRLAGVAGIAAGALNNRFGGIA